MEPIFIGIDVAKDRLDINIQPSGEAFTVTRDEAGLAELTHRAAALGPVVIALEATGGYEVVVAATLAAAALPVVRASSASVLARGPVDRANSRIWRGLPSQRRSARSCGRFRMPRRACSGRWWRGAASW